MFIKVFKRIFRIHRYVNTAIQKCLESFLSLLHSEYTRIPFSYFYPFDSQEEK
jgi:hypothetical protein